jgi:cyclopropane fatty-acyl-phospholipid synthase-like methyltransferase
MIATQNLDLYAKIEPLIGFDEAYEALYQIYLELLAPYKISSILDVGCGNGNFLLHLQKHYKAVGIDLSPRMVEIARQKGVEVYNRQLASVEEQFDAVVAVGDVLNYLRVEELRSFLSHVKRVLHEGGLFVCDVNTLHGFEEVTAGSMSADFDNQFLTIDAEFLEGILTTEMTLFERVEGECFKKEQDTILQFYHDSKRLKQLSGMQLLSTKDIAIFSEESDKEIYIFQNASSSASK